MSRRLFREKKSEIHRRCVFEITLTARFVLIMTFIDADVARIIWCD